ncbi:MAG: LuxR C-terminal-related transcriptional regulator [Pseudomonadota bacterium]
MSLLTGQQLKSVIRVGHLSQECVCEDDFSEIMTKEILRAFDSKSGVFLEFESTGGEVRLGDSISFGLDNVHSTRYSDHYHHLDPCYQAFALKQSGGEQASISTAQIVSSQREFMNSEYYQDFLRPAKVHESMIFGLGSSKAPVGLMGLHRRHGHTFYSDAEHTMVRLIRPYLTAAVRYRQRERELARQQRLKNLLLQSSSIQGYLLLDQRLVCLESQGNLGVLDSTALRDLTRQAGACVEEALPGRLVSHLRNCLQDHEISHLEMFDNLSPKDQVRVAVIDAEQGDRNILITVLNPNTHISSDDRIRYFGLTARQEEIVHLVEQGLTNAQIAALLSISSKTVINHLTEIYQKTRTHNRTSLLRQLFV